MTPKEKRIQKNRERGFRQERRIAAALEAQPMTTTQLAAKLHMSTDSVQHYLRLMRAASPKRVYVIGYEQVRRGAKPSAIHALGCGQDAVLVKQPHPVKAKRDESAMRREQILALLAEPMHTRAIAEAIGLSRSRTIRHIQALREEKKVYIKTYEKPEDGRERIAMYAAGNRPDAKRKKLTSAEYYELLRTDRDRMRRYLANRKALAIQAKTRQKPVTWLTALGL